MMDDIEPTVKFEKIRKGEYRVISDELTGKMQFMGTVVKSDRPMGINDKWWAYYPNGKSAGHSDSRYDASGFLSR